MRNDVTMESMIMDGIHITDGPFGLYPVINSFNAVSDKDFVDDPFFPDDPEVLMATGIDHTHQEGKIQGRDIQDMLANSI